MDFMKWLSSFDELLYEVMSWLIFYPMTLWRTITRPLQTMAYSSAELSDAADTQYEDVLRPPLFLVLSILLSHGLELATQTGENAIVASHRGLDQLVSDDTSLLVLRVLLFALLPLAMATRLVHRRHRRVTRTLLREPFYAQCYPAGCLALAVGLAGLAFHHDDAGALLGTAAILLVLLLYLALQAAWFARQLSESRWRGLADAVLAFVPAMIVFVLIARLLI